MYSVETSTSEYKVRARAEGIRLYRELSGNHSLPADRQYWTLCSRQTSPDSEINQMIAAGLIRASQFHGVDRDAELIAGNVLAHPEARWYAGEWSDVIEQAQDFNPGLIYLDTTAIADMLPARQMLVRTMDCCPNKTVVLTNVILRNWYHAGDDSLLESVLESAPYLSDSWDFSNIPQFRYCATGTTEMLTFGVYKR